MTWQLASILPVWAALLGPALGFCITVAGCGGPGSTEISEQNKKNLEDEQKAIEESKKPSKGP